MVLALNDVCMITDHQTLFEQDLVNVYFYQVVELLGTVTELEVANAFAVEVIPNIQNVQTTDLRHVRLSVDNITDKVGFAENPTGADGFVLPPTLPSYVAASYRLNRATKVTRPGYKRIAGIAELAVIDNAYDLTDPNVPILEVQLEISISATVDVLNEAILHPVIVGRTPVTGGFDLTRISQVTTCAAQENISTQVSRKAGR